MAEIVRKNPYQRLLEEIRDWCRLVTYRHEVTMFVYPKYKLNEGWSMKEVWDRTAAAEQLGYDVQIIADNDGLTIKYKKKLPKVPYSWQ